MRETFFRPQPRNRLRLRIQTHAILPQVLASQLAAKIKNAVKKVDMEALILAAGGEIKKFDRLLAEIEPMGKTMPVLYKKYLAQNAKILAFNRDRKFKT